MTRVIWNTPLEFYTKYTLGEIRDMKTHGEKRVRAILEVFHSLHVLVANMGTQEHLVVRIVPRRINRVEQWLGQALQTPGVPAPERNLRPLRPPPAGTGSHGCHPADRQPGGEPPGNHRRRSPACGRPPAPWA